MKQNTCCGTCEDNLYILKFAEQNQHRESSFVVALMRNYLSRKSDYENFLCTLLLPLDIKSAAFAVRAFNVEVAQVEDQVSDSRIGAMRMQFWMGALNDTYNGHPPKSPVALELHRVDGLMACNIVYERAFAVSVSGNQRSFFASCRYSSDTSSRSVISSV